VKIARILLCTVLLAGCGKLGQQFADIMRLSSDLAAQYHETIGVNIRNGAYLTLSVPMNDAQLKMSPEEHRAQSLEIARVARNHFPHADSLYQIKVVWVSRSEYGPVNYTRTMEGGSWTPEELSHEDSTSTPPQ
jgi:hypothetical protein